MNNEIKEIIDRFNFVKKEPNKLSYYPEDLLTREEMWLLLDYITNLQEENKELKKYFESDMEIRAKLLTRIDRLNNIIKVKTDFIEELVQIIATARDYELHDKVYTRGKIYEEKIQSLKGDSSNE